MKLNQYKLFQNKFGNSKKIIIFVKIISMTPSHNVKIRHDVHGLLLDESFVNPVQFKLFLKLLHSCVEMKQDLTFFNGVDFFVHIPTKTLLESIITTKLDTYTLTDHLINKSKLEALETK